MKSRKHIIVLVALAVYTVVMGLYQYKTNNAPLSDLLLTWGVMAVIIVLLYFLYSKMERMREQHQLEDEMVDPTEDDEDEDDSAYRLPKDK